MMNTKTIISLLSKTLLSLVLVFLFIFIVGMTLISGQRDEIIADFIDVVPKVISYLFLTLLTFFITDHWLQLRQKTNKIFPYFLYAILIPLGVSVISITITVFLINGTLQFVHVYYVIVYNTLVNIAIITFLAIFTYLLHNAKKPSKKIVSTFWITRKMIVNAVLYGFILSILYMVATVILFRSFVFEYTVLSIIRNTLFAVICWFLLLLFNRKFENKVSLPFLLIISFIGVATVMQLIIPLIDFIEMVLFHPGFIETYFANFSLSIIFGYNSLVTVYVLFCVLFYQLLYFSKIRAMEQKTFKATLGKQTEKYESLRRQLSPHFLFNNINVLTALIEEDPKRAVHFSESLGNIYRHFLRQEDEDVVSLESALSFSKDYLELLKYRYEEAFQYELPELTASNLYIIPLALQQVIENAIKHNEVSKEKPLHITFEIHDEYISIQNTKHPKNSTEKTKGTGIENIQKRYAFLTEKEVIIQDEVNSFTIKLPLLNMETT